MKLEDYIHSGEEILDDIFKLKPEQSRIFLHDDLTTLGCEETTTGIYFPVDLTAHILKLPSIELIPTAFHEYLGHGTFCEYSQYGQKLVEDEVEFINLDEESKNEFRTSKREDFERNRLWFEAAAIWTEFFLMDQLDENEMSERRLKYFQENLPDYYRLHQGTSEMENRAGKHDLWYQFGFPRQHDKDTLTEIAKEKLGNRFNNLIYLFCYGSKKPFSDIDLFAIFEDGTPLDDYWVSDTIDFLQYEQSDFLRKLNLFDVEVTEPVLTGNLVVGDSNKVKAMKTQLKTKKPSQDAIDFLFGESEKLRKDTKILVKRAKIDPRLQKAVRINLDYIDSYEKFARRYQEGSNVLTFKDLNNGIRRS